MTALYIILAVIGFIILLLLIPLKINLEYDSDVKLRIGYLFLRFTILPQKPEAEKPVKNKKTMKRKKTTGKPEADEEKKPPKKKRNPILGYIDQHGLDGFLELIKAIVRIVVEVLKKTAKHLTIKRLDIRLLVVGEDSADTAIKYGYACSVIYPAVSILENTAKLKSHSEDIAAGFLADKTAAELVLEAKIKPWFLIGIGIAALFKFIKAIAKQQ
ncbi:MAG: DUF2953 domain-containing protein [Clostridia bacterium]|nr:DUF2953 domain-containing protein [Clostridia bacterium]